jgi:hypothetical protein
VSATSKTDRELSELRTKIAQMMIGATIGSLRLMMPPEAIRGALQAWLDDPEAWQAVETHARDAASSKREQLAVLLRLIGALP